MQFIQNCAQFRNMKNFLITIIFILPFVSCSNQDNKGDNESIVSETSQCVTKLDESFKILFEENYNTYKVEFLESVNPNMVPNLYPPKELQKYCFMKFGSQEYEFIITTDTATEYKFPQHIIYFCQKNVDDYYYIDFFHPIYTNLNFLSECGINIPIKEGNQSGFHVYDFEPKLIGNWSINSTLPKTDITGDIEIQMNKVIINLNDTISVFQEGEALYRKTDSILAFVIGRQFGVNNMTLRNHLDTTQIKPITYYLTKNN